MNSLPICDEDLAAIARITSFTDEASDLAMQRLCERRGKQNFFHRAVELATEPTTEIEEDRPRIRQVVSIMRAVTPPPALVDTFLPDKRLVALTGKPKYGKSYLAMDLAERIARQQKVFGELAVSRSGSVVYLYMEDGEDELVERLAKRGVSLQDEGLPFYACTERVVLSKPEGITQLLGLMEEAEVKDPVLLIVDTAREALGISDWLNSSEITDKLRPLRMFSRKHCTVLIVAHNRKAVAEDSGDEISGSNAFTSSLDGWISATRAEELENGDRRLYLNIKGRGGMRGERVVQMDTHTQHFRLVQGNELAQEQQVRQRERRATKFQPLLNAIQNLGGEATIQEISIETGIGEETIRYQIGATVREGFVESTGKTKGKSKPAPLYRLTESFRKTENTYIEDFSFPETPPPSKTRAAASPAPKTADPLGPFGGIDDATEEDDETPI